MKVLAGDIRGKAFTSLNSSCVSASEPVSRRGVDPRLCACPRNPEDRGPEFTPASCSTKGTAFFSFYKFILFIYFWPHWVFVAAHGLSLVAASGGLLFVVVHGLLTVVAFLVVEHRL